jgi:Fur family ferric uptake transcriptional regulator
VDQQVEHDPVGAILQHMRERGGRVTTALRSIVEVLADSDRHLTATDIAEAVQRAHPAIYDSTIYRSLERLSEAGMVTHLHPGHGPTIYHLVGNHHGHLICDRCGTVQDVPVTLMQPVVRRVAHDYGFALRPGHVALAGLCADCASS